MVVSSSDLSNATIGDKTNPAQLLLTCEARNRRLTPSPRAGRYDPAMWRLHRQFLRVRNRSRSIRRQWQQHFHSTSTSPCALDPHPTIAIIRTIATTLLPNVLLSNLVIQTSAHLHNRKETSLQSLRRRFGVAHIFFGIGAIISTIGQAPSSGAVRQQLALATIKETDLALVVGSPPPTRNNHWLG